MSPCASNGGDGIFGTDNVIQGHALWHVLSAACFMLAFFMTESPPNTRAR